MRGAAARVVARLALGLLALGIAGCGLPLLEEVETPGTNTCTSDADCAEGVCRSVGDETLCVATAADLEGLVLQVVGTSDRGDAIAHVFRNVAALQGSSPGGVTVRRDLDIPQPVRFEGSIRRANGPVAGCTGADGSLPVKVELRSTGAYAELEPVVVGNSAPETTAEGLVHRWSILAPAGTYDVYVRPLEQGEDCAEVALVPRLFPDVEMSSDVEFAPLPEAPRRLTGELRLPEDRDITGYTVDLVDPRRGLVISETVAIDPGEAVATLEGAGEGLAYYHTPGLLLRLRDPDSRLAVHWSLEALDLDGDGHVELDLGDLIAGRRDFEAAVVDDDTAIVAGAMVTIKSVALTGEAGRNASFRLQTETDAAGTFEAALVPGTYQVLVVPGANGGAAMFQSDWIITADTLCCGRTFQLGRRPEIVGTVQQPDGDPFGGVSVVATPTLTAQRGYFAAVLEPLVALPRQSVGTTGETGGFSLWVDAGEFDVSVRTSGSSGFPWLVRPSVVVASADASPSLGLGTSTVPVPAVVHGTVTALGRVAPGAVVRAFLELSPSADRGAERLVAIGEAVADDAGRYRLALPPTVALQQPSF